MSKLIENVMMKMNVRTKPVSCNPLRIYLCKNNTTYYESLEASGIGQQYAYISLSATEHQPDVEVREVFLSQSPRDNESLMAVSS